MLKRYVLFYVLFLLFPTYSLLAQINNPVVKLKVIQGTSIEEVNLYSLSPIVTVDAFSENMSGEGFNLDPQNAGYFNLRYDASEDFEGIDVAVFETTETIFGPKSYVTVEIEVVRSLVNANDDFDVLDKTALIDVEVLSNDLTSSDQLEIVSIGSAHGGVFDIIDGQIIRFSPDEDFAGVANATYIIQDNQGTSDEANLFVLVKGDSPTSDVLNYLHVANEALVIILNDEGFELSNESQLSFGSLIKTGPFSFEYNSDLYIEGQESFTLTNKEGIEKFIEIDLITPNDHQSVLIDDVAYTVPGQYVVIDALANDYKNNGVIVDYSDGLLYASGIFAHIPDQNFEGVKEFFYSVNDGFSTHTAAIDVYVGNYTPRITEYVFQTTENTPLALEYNVPINAYAFTIIEEPTGGMIEVEQSSVASSCLSAEGNKMVIYTPDPDYIGTDNFIIEYCSDAGSCERLDVAVNVIEGNDNCGCVGPDCVWPGDTNHDGVVNVADLLPIGLHYGESGASRESDDWGAQSTDDWILVQVDGSNTNHVDANGDGLISALDTASIIANYANQDNFIADPTILDKNIPVRFEVNEPNLTSGDLLSIDIIIGSEEYPVIDLHGLAMSIPIPSSLISDSTNMVFVPNREWFGNNSPIIAMSVNQGGGQIDIGATRTENIGVSGSGPIGSLNTVVKIDVDELEDGKKEIPLKIKASKSFMIDGRGIPVQVNGAELELNVQPLQDVLDPNLIISDDIDILISPNPGYGPISFHANNNDELREVAIYDIVGQKVFERLNLQSNHLDIDPNFAQGLYIAHIKTVKGTSVQQIEVIK